VIPEKSTGGAQVTATQTWPRFRRRKIVLQPAYQIRVAVTILLFVVAYSLLLGFLIFYPLFEQFDAMASPREQIWIAREVIDLHKRFWPSVAVVGFLVAFQSFFVTHRLVGPAFHIQRILREFAAGRYTMRVVLRRRDRLKELEAAVNALGEVLLHREEAQRDREARLQVTVATVRAQSSGLALPPSLREALDDLERIAARPAGAE
jgi:HAMP domain-containing protein